jgi:ElaB/YqjD/DUF883 family membrane-anchored ribosome-binding protein
MDMSKSQSQFELLRSDLGKLTAAIGRLVDHQVSRSTGTVEAVFDDKVEAGREWLEHSVKDRPARSLGLAVGLGFVLGLLATRYH